MRYKIRYMRNIKLTIEYDGTHFHGWQSQGKNQRTVQGEIEKALKIIFRKRIKLIGSGRTDSGVHALGQVANFKTDSPMPDEKILSALNPNLPDDIAILNAKQVPLNFHAQYSARSKTYRYTIENRPMRPVIRRQYGLFYPYQLDLRLMKKEVKILLGRKNFKSFQATDPAIRFTKKDLNTIRNIKRIDINKTDDTIIIDIEADGFLYKMVRNIVGTILAIGSGKLSQGSMKKILAQKNREYAAATAKPHGLCLMKVSYS